MSESQGYFVEGKNKKLLMLIYLHCRINITPEKDQAGGIASRNYLRSLLLRRSSRLPDHAIVRVNPIEKDRYGRTVAEIFLGETFINAELVARGHAWHYERYSGNCPWGGKKEVPRLTCDDFESREAAQAAFDAGMPGTAGMDGDNALIVCEWD